MLAHTIQQQQKELDQVQRQREIKNRNLNRPELVVSGGNKDAETAKTKRAVNVKINGKEQHQRRGTGCQR